MDIVLRKEALRAGLIFYFTGTHCRQGHLCERYTSSTKCIECMILRSKCYYQKNRETLDKRNAEWTKTHPEAAARIRKKWNNVNKEKKRQYRLAYIETQ